MWRVYLLIQYIIFLIGTFHFQAFPGDGDKSTCTGPHMCGGNQAYNSLYERVIIDGTPKNWYWHDFLNLFFIIAQWPFIFLFTNNLCYMQQPIIRAVSRDFLGTLFFEMVIFPYRHHGSLWVRKSSKLLFCAVKYVTLALYVIWSKYFYDCNKFSLLDNSVVLQKESLSYVWPVQGTFPRN